MRYQDMLVYLCLERETIDDDFNEKRITGKEANRRLGILKDELKALNREIEAAGYAVAIGGEETIHRSNY